LPLFSDEPATSTPAAPAAPQKESFGWQRYAAAAVVALTLLAGGYGLRRADQQPAELVAAVQPSLQAQPEAVTEVIGSPEPMAVSTNSPAERLKLEVRRMEAYYASQIQEKQHELNQLEAAAAPGTTATAGDWKHELVGLDSTYRQLRAELQRNPDPDAVLEAMNRNLQIRLDILNQQLRTREQIQQYHDENYLSASK
jgi:hypothetical protein